jgi:transposase InsO family protein
MISVISQQSDLSPEGSLPIVHSCTALEVSRATFYRQREKVLRPDPEEMIIRDHIQRIALEWPTYGYRPITAELNRRYKTAPVNHKRVLRMMREDNLLCLRKHRRFIVTTDSNHGYRIYPNLAGDLTPTGLNQLWVSDITYIRLFHEFVYLAVILDAFSRRVIGWELSRQIDTELTLAALRMAINLRTPWPPGLIHHSDRGVQYAAISYTQLLDEHQIRISMSRKGNPYDNAQCERFMKTLKYDEVYLNEYEDLADARRRIGRFLDEVYNCRRLHSALGYLPPAEFEEQCRAQS